MIVAIFILIAWNILLTAMFVDQDGRRISAEKRLSHISAALSALSQAVQSWAHCVESRMDTLEVEKEVKQQMDLRH